MISGEYCELLQRQHKETVWGNSHNFRHMEELLPLLRSVDPFRILDFGAGCESFRRHLRRDTDLDSAVVSYDPGTGKTYLPSHVDVVICCDVLEHVEPKHIGLTLDTIFRIAQRAVYLVIALRQAGRPLVDGSPAHLIVESAAWWLALVARDGWDIRVLERREGYELRLWCTEWVAG